MLTDRSVDSAVRNPIPLQLELLEPRIMLDGVAVSDLALEPSDLPPAAILDSQGGLNIPYALTTGYYTADADMDAAVVSEFGPSAQVADWTDIKASYAGSAAEFCDAVGLSADGIPSAIVYRNGEGFWYSGRHYFVKRHDGIVPSNWLVHDQIDNNTLDLGSWYILNGKPILVRLSGNQRPNGTIDSPSDEADVELGQPINLRGSGSDPDGDSLSYSWDVTTEIPLMPTFHFNSEDPGAFVLPLPGTWTITLTVTDEHGLADSTPDSVEVTVIPGDEYEPNDTYGGAADLGLIEGTEVFRNLSILQNVDGSDNEDYFRFELAARGNTSDYVEIQFSQADGNLDMKLYPPVPFNLVTARSVSNNERISLAGLPAGEYVLRVYGRSNATALYNLKIVAPTVELAPDAYESNDSFGAATDLGLVTGEHTWTDLTVHDDGDGTSNHDFFRFRLAAEGNRSDFVKIEFSHGDGDLDLRLYNKNRQFLDVASSVTDNERISLDEYGVGVYYARIYSHGGEATAPYEITIEGPAPDVIADAYESNDDLDSEAASDLGAIEGRFEIPNLTIHANANRTANEDYYRFEMLADGTASDYFRIKFDHDDANLDLDFFDRDGNWLMTSHSRTDGEKIPLSPWPAGVYYARVYSPANQLCSYDIVIEGPEVVIIPDVHEANDEPASATALGTEDGVASVSGATIHLNPNGTPNDDYYQFQMDAEGQDSSKVVLSFWHQQGDLDLKLYNDAGEPLDKSLGTSNTEEIGLAGRPAGTYVVKVVGWHGGTSPGYDLTITTPPALIRPDDFEGNEPIRLDEQNRNITGLTIHDPSLFGGYGTQEDVFAFTTTRTAGANNFIQFDYEGSHQGLVWLLRDDEGTIWHHNTMNPDGGWYFSLDGLPQGDYILTVTSVEDETVDYGIQIQAPFTEPSTAAWTIMVYLAGDNDLSAVAIETLNELEAARPAEGIRITVLIDLNADYTEGLVDWDDTRVGVVHQDNNSDRISSALTSWEERNTGDPERLEKFIAWSSEVAPAEHYALVITGHGGVGTVVASDNHNGGDSNSPSLRWSDIRDKLDALTTEDRIDVLALESCNMATLELVYGLGSCTDYVVASEGKVETALGGLWERWESHWGFNHTEFLNNLTASASPKRVAELMVSCYPDKGATTISATATDSQLLSSLTESLGRLVIAIRYDADGDEQNAILSAIAAAAAPKGVPQILRDLGCWLQGVANVASTPSVAKAAGDALGALRSLVVSNYATNDMTGLLAWMENSGAEITTSQFCEVTHLDELQAMYEQFVSGVAPVVSGVARDWGENNELMATAHPLTVGGFLWGDDHTWQSLTLHKTDDVDWFSFRIGATGELGDDVSVLYDSIDAQLRIDLYDANEVLLDSNDVGLVSMEGMSAGKYYVRVSNDNFGVCEDYTLIINAPDSPNVGDDWAEGADSQQKALALPNDVLTGGLNVGESDVDWYLFSDYSAADRMPLLIEVRTPEGEDAVHVALFDADGNLLDETDSVNGLASFYHYDTNGIKAYVRVTGSPGGGDVPYSISAEHDMAEVSLAAVDAEADEAGPGSGIVRVTRSGPTGEDLAVELNWAGTAENGVDYEELPGTVIIPAGETSVDMVVTAIDDALPEAQETVNVSLGFTLDYAFGDETEALVTILDDELTAVDVWVGDITNDAGTITVGVYDMDGGGDVTLDDVRVRFNRTGISSILLGGNQSMDGLVLVVSGAPLTRLIRDVRRGPLGSIAAIVSDGPINSILLKSDMTGCNLNDQEIGELVFDADIDNDGELDDLTAIYCVGAVGSIKMADLNAADIVLAATDNTRGTSLMMSQVVAGSDIYSAYGIHLIRAVTIADSVTISAPWINTLQVTGDRRAGTAGDMGAAVTLTGADPRRSMAFNQIKVAGEMTGQVEFLAGAGGTVNVGYWTAGGLNGTYLNSISVTGDRRAGIAGDLAGDITLTGADPRRGVAFKSIRASGAITSDINLLVGAGGTITGGSWTDGSFSGTFLRSIMLNGDRLAGTLGNLGAAIDLTGNDGRGSSISTLKASGTISSQINLAAGVNSIMAGAWNGGGLEATTVNSLSLRGDRRSGLNGDLANATINLAGNLRSFTAATMSASMIYVGYDEGTNTFAGGDYTINSLRLTDRNRSNMTGGSWIACNRFRNASMAFINGDDGGTPFGYITGDASSRISILNPRWGWDGTDGDRFGDYIVHLI